jgi:hypothetical protein
MLPEQQQTSTSSRVTAARKISEADDNADWI